MPVHSGDRLPAEDAAFLYLETDAAPLHIGSVSVLDGAIRFEDYVRFIAARLPLIPRYRQRLVFPPLHLGHPTWEDDPGFDIRNHVREVHLKRGTVAELERVSGQVFSQRMDRAKPLWDLTLVQGLGEGRSAFIARVHHCLVDGVSGVGILNVMLSATPESQPIPKARPFKPQPLPDSGTSLADALVSAFTESVQRILSAQMVALNTAEALISSEALDGWSQALRLAPELLAPVERLPFNRPIRGPRRVAWAELSFADVNAIRQALGGTLNDVALAAVTLAVGRYLELHRQSTRNRLLRLMVPVNLRHKEKQQGFGNRVSALPVNIPLDIRDPAELLRAIRQRTEAMKSAHIANLIELSGAWMGLTPAAVLALLGPIAATTPGPLFHLVCTNVPGPQYPLYLLGRKMATFYPYLPIANEFGIGWAIQSYNANLYFGLTADTAAVPDIRRLNEFLEEAFSSLCRAAGVLPTSLQKPADRAKPLTQEEVLAVRT